MRAGPVFGGGWGSIIFTPSHLTPAGANVTVQTGSVAVSYSNVTASGSTIVGPMPMPPAALLPANYALTGSSMAYNVETLASFTGPNKVCFNLLSIPDEFAFNRMQLLHFENGVFVDRTISRAYSTLELCAEVSSFSPFVAALAPLAPTAANVEVSGRVFSPSYRGIKGARVQLIGADSTASALSNPFGYFVLRNIQVGDTYILEINHKRYRFDPQTLNILDEVTGLEVVALNHK